MSETNAVKCFKSVEKHISENCAILEKYSKKLAQLYRNCYPSTLNSAIKELEDGSIFVLTGDIPAMWLRDSAAQVNHYLSLAGDPDIAQIIKKVILKQFQYIVIDPYANAFNESANGHGHADDLPAPIPWVWERKYEVDSLCYPIKLLYKYWRATGDRSIIENEFKIVLKTILSLWKTEQYHNEKSFYGYVSELVINGNIESDNFDLYPTGYTGMTWSGFRPSDDACIYGYLVPSNMFAATVLGYAAEMLEDGSLKDEALTLKAQIEEGIEKFAVVEHKTFGKVYAYEVDGMGNYVLRDDANIPSLLSAPYLEYEKLDPEIYANTRRLLLSKENPHYFEGKFAKGIGSPHTPEGYIWHMALIMQGLTSESREEKLEILSMLERTDGGTGFMHEGFLADDPTIFTREWFTWPNSLLCEFIEKCIEEDIFNKE